MASEELLIRISGRADEFVKELDRVKSRTKNLEQSLTTVAKTASVAFVGLAGSVGLASKEFAQFEKALIGVGKTTNLSGKELDKFGDDITRLSREIPVSANELLGLAQTAGQLGVTGTDNLLKFSETIAKLGVASDLSGEQAATALTRILNVTNESIGTIDKFASVIVALGNNFAATESEITRVATEVARSTAVFKLGSANVAGIATALKSLGVQAQLGGSAVGRAFREIDASIRQGGQRLEALANITGIAGNELRQAFSEDATQVFQRFVAGLGEIQKSGGDTTGALKEFGLQGDEILKVLPVLAQRADLLGDALKVAGDEAKNATALNEEAAKAFGTLSADTQRLVNSVTELAVRFGKALAPQVSSLIRGLTSLVQRLSDMDATTFRVIARVAVFATSLAGIVATASTLAVGFLKLRPIIIGLRAAFTGARLAVVGFTSAATFGLSAVLAFLPEIISGLSSLLGIGEDNTKNEVEKLTDRLDKLRKKREEIANTPIETDEERGLQEARLRRFDAEIDKLQKIKSEREAIANLSDDQVQKLLFEPEKAVSAPPPPEDLERQIREEVTREESPEERAERERQLAAELERKKQEAILKEQKEGAQRLREIRQQQREIFQLEERQASLEAQEITSARQQALADEEKKGLEEQLKLKREAVANASEIDKLRTENAKLRQEERLTALEEAQLEQNEMDLELLENHRQNILERQKEFDQAELERIREREAARREVEAEEREVDLALEEEIRALKQEKQAELDEKEREQLREQLKTRRDIRDELAKEQLKENIKRRNQFLKDEEKFGTAVAQLNQAFSNERVKAFRETSGQLQQLTQSRNRKLFEIGKAAALANIAIDTARGAVAAYQALAPIPFVGPALGAAAAAALIAFGVEQAQAATQTQFRGQRGGVVPGAGSGDRVPLLAEPGEIIVPKSIAPTFEERFGDLGAGETQSAQQMNFTFNGTIIGSREFVAQEMVPMIREAVQFDNADLGVA